MQPTRSGVFARFGDRPRAIRRSAICAACLWIATAGCAVVETGRLRDLTLRSLLWLAIAATALWIVHILAFAVRNMRTAKTVDGRAGQAAPVLFAELVLSGIVISLFPNLSPTQADDGACPDHGA
ncbi:hypothetical protein ASG03_13740 [Rhizobium sp. Leaf341]|nr:hypothetical protein ASG03_13740 [Rhizobium sp. Leaf341]